MKTPSGKGILLGVALLLLATLSTLVVFTLYTKERVPTTTVESPAP